MSKTTQANTVITTAEEFTEALRGFQKAEQQSYNGLVPLFAYALGQLVAFENPKYINALIKVATPKNQLMIGAVAQRCSVWAFARQDKMFINKKSYGKDIVKETKEIQLQEDTYNFFQTECDSNIWTFEEKTKEQPKREKPAKVITVKSMVTALSNQVFGHLSVTGFENQIEEVVRRARKMNAFYWETIERNPDMDRNDILRAYYKANPDEKDN